MIIHLKNRDNPFLIEQDIFQNMGEMEIELLMQERRMCRNAVSSILSMLLITALIMVCVFKGYIVAAIIISGLSLFGFLTLKALSD